jgi:hypothetical protein
MKKFLIVIILSLCFTTSSQAVDMSDFQINGISIDESLLDHFTRDEIKKNSIFLDHAKGNKEFKKYYSRKNTGEYDEVAIAYKNFDQSFPLASIQGIIWFKNDIESCLKKRDEIIEELKSLFKDKKFRDEKKKVHFADKNSYTYDYYIFFGDINDSTSDHISISCYDWSKKLKYRDHLRIAIVKKEYMQWLVKLAGK